MPGVARSSPTACWRPSAGWKAVTRHAHGPVAALAVDHQCGGAGPVFRHPGRSDRRSPAVAGAGRALDRCRVHAGQPPAPPTGIRDPGTGFRSPDERSLRRAILDLTVPSDGGLAEGRRAYPFPPLPRSPPTLRPPAGGRLAGRQAAGRDGRGACPPLRGWSTVVGVGPPGPGRVVVLLPSSPNTDLQVIPLNAGGTVDPSLLRSGLATRGQ